MDYKKYFDKLIALNTKRKNEFPNEKIFKHTRDTDYYSNKFTYMGFQYNFVISTDKSTKYGKDFIGLIVELLIDDKDYAESYFYQLYEYKDEIEDKINFTNIYWRQKESEDRANRYRLYSKLEIDIEDESLWETAIEWQINTMIKFLQVLPSYTKKLTEETTYIEYPDELIKDDDIELFEGIKKEIVVNAYERNPTARNKCIEHYGFSCQICDFNFQEVFGEIGKNFIHVHHIKPLSEIDAEYVVNPINDLIPICPNCHAMIHKKKPAYTIDEIKNLMKI